MKKTSLYLSIALLALCSCGGRTKQHLQTIAETKLEEKITELTSEQTPAKAATVKAEGDLRLCENPSGMKAQLLERTAYLCSYNSETRLPNWVAWELTRDHTDGPNKRKGIAFQEDTEAEGRSVTTQDYSRSGYDRSHMCPAGDNKWSREAMEQSFLMTNICPQTHSLNAGDWNDLEEQCRKWAEEYGSVYIVSGPLLEGTQRKKIGKARVVVPEKFFKVVLTMEGSPRAIGYVFSNDDEHHPLEYYATTVDQVEQLTGLDFFPALPDEVENKIEAEERSTL